VGIDYVIARDCPPKGELGVQGIVDLVKSRSRAEAVVSIARGRGDQRPVAEITFTTRVMRPGGAEDREVSVGALLQQSAALEVHRPKCVDCPADLRKKGFGCYDSINYPLSKESEQWLLSRLPPNVSCTAGQLLMRALKDFDWGGAQARKMRSQGQTFFESRETLSRRYEDGAVSPITGKKMGLTITSDEVFHMLFHVGHIEPTHALMVCLFFGLLPYDTDPDLLDDPSLLARASVEPQPGKVEQLAAFLRAAAVSARLDVPLLVDG
jgi:hypothetical protein